MTKTVRVFSTDTCPWCVRLKDFLKEKSIRFEEINLMDDQEAAEEMIAKSGQRGVPVTIIKDEGGRETVIVGFDRARISTELGIEE